MAHIHTVQLHIHILTWRDCHCKAHSSSSGWVGVHHLNPHWVANTSCKPLPVMTEFCHGRVGALGSSQGKGDILNFNKPLTQTSQAEVAKSSSILSEVGICIPLEDNCGVPLKGNSKVLHCGFIYICTWGRDLKFNQSCWFQTVYVLMHHVMYCFLMLHQTNKWKHNNIVMQDALWN